MFLLGSLSQDHPSFKATGLILPNAALFYIHTSVLFIIIKERAMIRRECDKIKAPRSGGEEGKPLTTERQREERNKVKKRRKWQGGTEDAELNLFVPVVPCVVKQPRNSGSEGKFLLVIVPFKVNRT